MLLVAVLFAAAPVLGSAAEVKTLWKKNCTQCHGDDGKGVTKMGQKLNIPDLTDAKVQADFRDDKIIRNIKEGVKDAEGKFRMKPIENLTDGDIKALINYVRTLKGK